MGRFNDQMKTMTMSMRASATERHDELAQLFEDTDQVLKDARTFINVTSDDHHAMADQLHHDLADERTALHDQVQEMRRHNQESHHQMGHDLRERLSKDTRHLKKEVAALLHRCDTAQHKLADDLRHASQTWRKFAQRKREDGRPA